LISGCALLPKEKEEEILPSITPPKLSKKPEYTVTTNTLESKVRGIGKMMSMREESLFFIEDNRRIKELYVRSGDEVTPGQIIAELDVTDLERSLKAETLQSRKDELQMIELLRKADELSADQMEQAKIDFQQKRQKLVDLQNSINRSKMMAPFAGTVVSVLYQKGDPIRAYETIASIANLDELTVAATITTDDLKKVSVGMEVVVDINAAGQHKGTVQQLPIPKKDQNQGGGFYDPNNPNNQKQQDRIENYLVVKLHSTPEGLSRGTPLSVAVITQRKENAVVIPLAALRSYGGRNYVQVIEPSGSKREVDIEIGQQSSTEVEIIQGLQVGQKVVGR
jgi:macrolide-specific efflux system membrane fusion protein